MQRGVPQPGSCARCGATEGEALGHDAPEATCTEAAVCARCGETVEEALGHDWIEATCTEAAVCAPVTVRAPDTRLAKAAGDGLLEHDGGYAVTLRAGEWLLLTAE